MRQLMKLVVIVLSLFTIIISCDKEDDEVVIDNRTIIEDEETVADADPTTYIVGYKNLSGRHVATLWENGKETTLSNSSQSSEANAIHIEGSDVYIAGVVNTTGDYQVVTVWRNGLSTSISDGSHWAGVTSLDVAGSDVYVTGFVAKGNLNCNVATLWKNGSAIDLSDGTYNAEATSVFVSGSDVYVSGFKFDAEQFSVATLWKNGIETSLSSQDAFTVATSVFVLNKDVYAVGQERVKDRVMGKLWKNGIVNDLGEATTNGLPVSIFVNPSNVYIAINEFNEEEYNFTPKVLLNGSPIALSKGNSFNAMFVAGSDLYVVGFDDTKQVQEARLWQKVGESTELTTDFAVPNGAFLDVYIK